MTDELIQIQILESLTRIRLMNRYGNIILVMGIILFGFMIYFLLNDKLAHAGISGAFDVIGWTAVVKWLFPSKEKTTP